MALELFGTIVVPLGRAGKFGKLEVRTNEFAQNVHEHVYTYGLRQILNDAMADKKDEDGNIVSIPTLVAMAQKRLDTLYSGELRSRRSEIEPVDPIEAQAWVLARVYFNAVFKPQFPIVPKGTKDRILWLVNQDRVGKQKKAFADIGEMYDAFFEFKSEKAQEIWAQAEKDVGTKAETNVKSLFG